MQIPYHRIFSLVTFPLLILFLTADLFAEDENWLRKGDSFPKIIFTNQFEKEAPIAQNTKKVIFVSDMDASKIVHSVLEKDGDSLLNQSESVLISDIHKMPGLITKFVALPKMRSYSYTIHLIREENIGSTIPRKKGLVTLIFLDREKITSIEFVDEAFKLREFINSNHLKTEPKN
ncbi:hypothetical protein LPTSP3_g14300 [Leptospira kobayashii]|uniref:Uncharacterized protein n=1 Tax=Leptospira kobayashii TaxID=1917830 RepID=A0ABN6KC30_9LEPT|nr:hypothetical protein [Leptospira kobayashii]BDA78500.1 hypothetical protein LPTSP3_g14300 [Leptospira kobayashii]